MRRTIDYNLFPSQEDLALAQANGTDRHSVAGNPQFVDPSRGDYSIRPTSPALKIGYRNVGMDHFGVRTPRLRALAAKPEFSTSVVTPRADQRETPRSFVGMTIKSVETLGEQSAAGLATKAGVIVQAVEPGGAAGCGPAT